MKKVFFIALTCMTMLLTVSACGNSSKQADNKNPSEANSTNQILKLQGKINDKYPIHMIIDLDNLVGAYYYDKSGADHYLTLKIGSYNEASGNITLNEYNDKGEQTGEFSGVIDDSGFKGNAKFGAKTMPFNLEVCTDPAAQFPALAVPANTTAYAAGTSDNVTPEPVDNSNKTIVLTAEYKDSTVTYMSVSRYTIELDPAGIYKIITRTKNGTRYSSAEPYEWQQYNPEEETGTWDIYNSFKVGRDYPDFYRLKRSGSYDDMFLSPDLKYIWWGNNSWDDARSYNISHAVKSLSVTYK